MTSNQIRLRSIRDDDLTLLFEWINDRHLVAFNAPYSEVSESEHNKWFKQIGERKDVVFFMIDNVDSDETIGSCQLFNIHPIHRSAELQIRIGKVKYLNHGAGTEAVRQLVEFGFQNLNLHRISLHVFATNERAICVYEKNGFIQEGLLRQAAFINNYWVDVIVMGLINSDHC